MNYRAIMNYTEFRIETTHEAAEPGSCVYGTLKLARAHLEMWIDREIDNLREAKRYWRSVPERKLPSDEPKIEQASAQEEPPDDDLGISHACKYEH